MKKRYFFETRIPQMTRRLAAAETAPVQAASTATAT